MVQKKQVACWLPGAVIEKAYHAWGRSCNAKLSVNAQKVKNVNADRPIKRGVESRSTQLKKKVFVKTKKYSGETRSLLGD